MNPPDTGGPTSPGEFAGEGAYRHALRAALSSAFTAGVVTGGIYLLSAWIEKARDAARKSEDEVVADPPEEPILEAESDSIDDDEAVQAARLLGVPADASECEIRAALRARFKETALHPDHGGDAETARDLIAAKNLLIERARAVPA